MTKKLGKLVGVCNCQCHCGLPDDRCFTEHDEVCDHCRMVEITTVVNISKGEMGFGTYLGGIDIIPDPNIPNGRRRTIKFEEASSARIFISPMNYRDLKEFPNTKQMLLALNFLTEVD